MQAYQNGKMTDYLLRYWQPPSRNTLTVLNVVIVPEELKALDSSHLINVVLLLSFLKMIHSDNNILLQNYRALRNICYAHAQCNV